MVDLARGSVLFFSFVEPTKRDRPNRPNKPDEPDSSHAPKPRDSSVQSATLSSGEDKEVGVDDLYAEVVHVSQCDAGE